MTSDKQVHGEATVGAMYNQLASNVLFAKSAKSSTAEIKHSCVQMRFRKIQLKYNSTPFATTFLNTPLITYAVCHCIFGNIFIQNPFKCTYT